MASPLFGLSGDIVVRVRVERAWKAPEIVAAMVARVAVHAPPMPTTISAIRQLLEKWTLLGDTYDTLMQKVGTLPPDEQVSRCAQAEAILARHLEVARRLRLPGKPRGSERR